MMLMQMMVMMAGDLMKIVDDILEGVMVVVLRGLLEKMVVGIALPQRNTVTVRVLTGS